LANVAAAASDGWATLDVVGVTIAVFALVILGSLAWSLFMIVRRGELPLLAKSMSRFIGDVLGSLIGVGSGYSPPTIAKDLEDLIKALERRAVSPAILSEQAEQRVISIFEDAIGAGLNDEIRLALASLVEKQVKDEVRLRSLASLNDVQGRLQQAAKIASIRGFFNLAIGISFAVTALLVLKSAVELFRPTDLGALTLSQALYVMGVRVSLALIITLIAYFFLSLYRNSLEDVKYYQNEMTYIGLSATSIGVAYDCESDSVRQSVAQTILQRGSAVGDTQVTDPDQTNLVGRLIEKLIDKVPTSK
jgi:hypothetical protein